MTREELLAALFPSVPGDLIKTVMQAVDAFTAAKDREIDRLNVDARSLQYVIDRQKRKLDERLATMQDRRREIKTLREGLVAIPKSQEYEGFLLVDPSAIEALLNPGGGKETPTRTAKDSSDDEF